MIFNKEIFNPIITDSRMPDEVFAKYIVISNRRRKSSLALSELTAEVKKVFYGSHPDIVNDKLDKIWAFMYPMVSHNEALANFILDCGGAKSDFFFPWMISVATSPSEALELSYNAGRNLNGEWITEIPKEDKINYFVYNLPTLAFNRERQFRVADLVSSDKVICGDRGSKVIDLGAGRMAWARHHGFKFKPRIQQIIACDKDPNIQPDALFAPRTLDEIRLTYRRNDIMRELRDTDDCIDASFVILQGVASYYPISMFKKAIVEPVYNCLREGGSFFFDLQLDHVSYEWSEKVFGWPQMNMPESASVAIDEAENLRKSLWDDGMKFRAEYMLDTYNASPLSVMILFTKI